MNIATFKTILDQYPENADITWCLQVGSENTLSSYPPGVTNMGDDKIWICLYFSDFSPVHGPHKEKYENSCIPKQEDLNVVKTRSRVIIPHKKNPKLEKVDL